MIVEGTVQRIERKTSRGHAPVYELTLESGMSYRTGSNSASGFYASNIRAGDKVGFTLIRNRISDIKIIHDKDKRR